MIVILLLLACLGLLPICLTGSGHGEARATVAHVRSGGTPDGWNC